VLSQSLSAVSDSAQSQSAMSQTAASFTQALMKWDLPPAASGGWGGGECLTASYCVRTPQSALLSVLEKIYKISSKFLT